jgi:hypothetical protein
MEKIQLIWLMLCMIPVCSCSQTVSASVLAQLDNTEKAMFQSISQGDSAAFGKIAGTDYFTINADGAAQSLGL